MPQLDQLYSEILAHSGEPAAYAGAAADEIAIPLRIRDGERELAFISVIATFGTPVDVTVADLMIESFFPADGVTASTLGTPAVPQMRGLSVRQINE